MEKGRQEEIRVREGGRDSVGCSDIPPPPRSHPTRRDFESFHAFRTHSPRVKLERAFEKKTKKFSPKKIWRRRRKKR